MVRINPHDQCSMVQIYDLFYNKFTFLSLFEISYDLKLQDSTKFYSKTISKTW
jgi:hypothetical protein